MPILPAVPRVPLDAPETIERAAIRHGGRVYAAATMDHVEVARSIRAARLFPVTESIGTAEKRGFVTSRGRFVDVDEGRRLAKAAGQVL